MNENESEISISLKDENKKSGNDTRESESDANVLDDIDLALEEMNPLGRY